MTLTFHIQVNQFDESLRWGWVREARPPDWKSVYMKGTVTGGSSTQGKKIKFKPSGLK